MLEQVTLVTPDVRSKPTYLRAVAATLALLLGTAAVGRSYCPMRSPAPAPASTAADAARDAHDCCKKGLTGAKPSCCHADTATNAVVLLKTASMLLLPCASSWLTLPPIEVASVDALATSAVVSPSPPPRVLRI